MHKYLLNILNLKKNETPYVGVTKSVLRYIFEDKDKLTYKFGIKYSVQKRVGRDNCLFVKKTSYRTNKAKENRNIYTYLYKEYPKNFKEEGLL